MSNKERSVRFSTKKPIEHESFDYPDNSDFDRIMKMPLPPVYDDNRFNQLDLYTASSLGSEYVDQIIKNILNFGEKNCNGWTALMYAAYLGHVKVCELLWSKGANIESVNDLGQTSLMLAASCGSKELIEFLIKVGADVNKQDKRGQSALHYATRYNQSTITEHLVKAGSDCNMVDINGMTPTLNACKVGNDATVSLLLKYKGDPNRVNNSGENGEMLASEHPNVIKVLQSRLTMNDLLKQLGLEKYIPIFERDEINLNLFLKLTEQDLNDMGITLFGPKKKLMNVIKHYQQHGVIATEQDVVIAVTPSTVPNSDVKEHSQPNDISFGHRQEITGVPEIQHDMDNLALHSPKKTTVNVNISDINEQILVNTEARRLLSLFADRCPEALSTQCHGVIDRMENILGKLKNLI